MDIDLDGWTVSIEVEDRTAPPLESESIDRLMDEFVGHGGCVSAYTTHGRYGSTFSLYGYEDAAPWQVLRRGLQVFRDAATRAAAPAFPVVSAEILTFAEHDREVLGDK